MDADISSTGLTVVLDPEEAALDIVFVHGFKGHPERTWTHKGVANNSGSEPPIKVRRHGLNPFSSQRKAVYWPRDLLKDSTPGARVMTYGYDTNIRHIAGKPICQSTVYDIAGDFLIELEARRRKECRRSLIFVAHSLGGIVVKEMLRRSNNFQHDAQAHLKAICESTIGIMFFGTPHQGADPLRFQQKAIESLAKAVGFTVNKQIIETLLPTSERLRELRDEFGPMAQRHAWIIHSFQESRGVKALEGRKVVDDTSSYINLPEVEISQHINRDHMEMCRFTGPSDHEFRKVEAALLRMIEKASTLQPRSHHTQIETVSQHNKKDILTALSFDLIDFRRTAIKTAHQRTCSWLLKESGYTEWFDSTNLDKDYVLLWIKGKPGAGKSTLMKFAYFNAVKTRRDRTTISFFFNARGGYLERSTEGMYRSLLTQLLQHVRTDQDILQFLAQTFTARTWSIETLKEAFQQAVLGLDRASVVCFIDALDECEENQIRDMVSFFENLSELIVESHVEFRVCLASRHYPHVSIRRGQTFTLENQGGHCQDIEAYIDSELKIGSDELAQQFRADLQEKAAGVFMWVVLVVGILNKEYDSGKKHTLSSRLAEIPSDLHGLFRDIMTRDNSNQEDLLHCIQWILFSSRPLTLRELYFALLEGSAEDPRAILQIQVTSDDQQRRILDASKGLAEVVQTHERKAPFVQFIHESVRDFFLKDDGFAGLWPELRNNFTGHGHEYLRETCAIHMGRDLSDLAFLSVAQTQRSKQWWRIRNALEAFPLMGYAVRNVLYHADRAHKSSFDQSHFLVTFPKSKWIWLFNAFENHKIRRYTPATSILYILAEANLDALISICPGNLSYLELEAERYRAPIIAAMATGSNQAIHKFLELEIVNQPKITSLPRLYELYRSQGASSPKCGRDLRLPEPEKMPATISVEHLPAHDGLLLSFLLATKKVIIPSWNIAAKALATLRKNNPATYLEVLVHLSEAFEHMPLQEAVYAEALRQSLNLRYCHLIRQLLDPNDLMSFWEESCKSTEPSSPKGNISSVCNDNDLHLTHILRRYDLSQPSIPASGNSTGKMFKWGMQGANLKSNINSEMSSSQPANHVSHDLSSTLRNIDFDSRDPRTGDTLLMVALGANNEHFVKFLLATGLYDTSHGVNKYGESALVVSARHGSVEALDILLSSKSSKDYLNRRDSSGFTPLHAACEAGHHAIVERLLSTNKVNPNIRNRRINYQYPLHTAVINGFETIVRSLLAYEGEFPTVPEVSDRQGCTPLDIAVSWGKSNIVRLLLDKRQNQAGK